MVLGEVLSLQAAELAVVLAVFLIKTAADIRRSRGLWTGLLLLAVLCGFFRGEWCSFRAERIRERLDGERATVTGMVKSLEPNPNGVSGVLISCRMEPDGEKLGRISVFFEKDPGLCAGDRIRITGRCSSYEPASNPGEFDYRSYYESLGITGKMNGESWELLPGGSGFRRKLEKMRGRLGVILDDCTGEYSGIFKAMLLGDKSSIPQQVYDLYQENGISHLLAISGLHISMLGMGFYRLVRKAGAGKRTAAAAGICLMLCYGTMTGFSPSTQRAVIMYSVSVLSGCVGRTYDLPTALGTAAAVILWREPAALAQGGVQLSFLAVGGVGVLGRELERAEVCRSRPGRIFLGGLAVQAATYPAVVYHYFVYPPYGIFLNFLVIPLMTYAMISGLLCLAAGMVSPAAGRLCAGSGVCILRLYEMLCRCFTGLPGSRLSVGRPALWQLALYGAVLGIFLLLIGRIRRKKLSLAVAGTVLFFILLPVPETGLRITYLDVGQGDGIVLQADGSTALIDGGSTDRKKLGSQVLEPFLLSQGISRMDWAAVSHCDSDHISGLKELLEGDRIRIGRLLLPAGGEKDEAQQELVLLAQKKGIPVVWMEKGDSFSMGRLKMFCLAPGGARSSEEDRNERSMVLMSEYGEAKFLFTGDISAEKEKELLRQTGTGERLNGVTVLKAAHHGSDSSSCREFLEAVRPVWAVLSYGEGNSYGHPSKEVTDRLKEGGAVVLETARDGAISVKTDGKKLRVRIFCE